MKTKFFILGFAAALVVITISFFVLSKWSDNTQTEELKTELKLKNNFNATILNLSSLDIQKFKPINKLNNLPEKEILIINFWATWCAPCIFEMKEFQKLYNSEGDKYDFIFASNEELIKIQKFISRNQSKYNLPFYSYEKESLSKSFENKFLPVTYIINRKTNIVFKIDGVNNWNSDLFKQYLKTISKN